MRTLIFVWVPVPILLYHDVSPEPADVYGVTDTVFARHMQLVAASGRHPMTIDGYADALRGAAPLPERPVLVTFDDGYRQFPAAVEAMAHAGVAAATIYLTTGQLDQPGRARWHDLAALPSWVQVGAHTRTHPQLDVLPPGRVAQEVQGSKQDVEQRLGRPCTSFAYPHGHYDKAVRAAVVSAEFGSAAAVKNALSHPRDDLFALARMTITGQSSEQLLLDVLDGRGAPVASSRERLRTRAFRVCRRFQQRRATTAS